LRQPGQFRTIQLVQEAIDILESLGNIGDFVGGLAVVVTLVYLAIQIRHNTTALRAASRQAIADGYREANRLFLEPGVAHALRLGLSAYPKLPFEELNRFGTVVNDQALFFQSAFALHESGQLDDSTYRAYLDWFCSILATPGGGAWWETVGRPIYVGAMVSAADERLALGGLHDIRQIALFRLDEPDET